MKNVHEHPKALVNVGEAEGASDRPQLFPGKEELTRQIEEKFVGARGGRRWSNTAERRPPLEYATICRTSAACARSAGEHSWPALHLDPFLFEK